jgi:hypothetical protein
MNINMTMNIDMDIEMDPVMDMDMDLGAEGRETMCSVQMYAVRGWKLHL